MQYKEFLRIEKIKKTLDFVAYASLGLDIGIAIVTLVSLRAYSQQLNQIQFFLNIALTAEVLATLVLLAALLLLYHYEKILDNLARFSRALTRSENRKGRNR